MFFTSFNLRHTAADAAGKAVFMMKNLPTNPVGSTTPKGRILLRSFEALVGFDGTGAASRIGYEALRYNGADPTSGGARGRVKLRGSTASLLTDAALRSGAPLVDTPDPGGLDASGAFWTCTIPTTAGTVMRSVYNAQEDPKKFIVFEPGEGWVIRLAVIAVIGLSLAATVLWEEKNLP